ncbi:alpha/beta fold hydrolase [Streptomyces sp. NPDC003300]|uniref:alpha/beta hydrolase n=1 Tax=unclassified Streptomyces TaxID=2593676 RepID=UPI0033AE6716
MTAYVLVAGAHTGGWIWQETARALREAGARAYPVTLTGMGDGGRPAGPDTDLETHIRDVLEVIDAVAAAEGPVVLVGHDYGIHPVVGAADRRPARTARVVHLDTGIPQDGDPPLALYRDQELRDRAQDGDGPVPPPSGPEEWARHGSTAGVPADALARLTDRAVPQPRATLTRPLRLTGAVAALPVTGVFCTANGSSIALVETLVGLGDPRLAVLTEPRVTFFDLGTGHWPMLSAPRGLADILLRAVAGEGRRLAPRGEQAPQQRPFPLPVPELPRERHGRVDLHLPRAEHPSPAVVFVHGGPVSPDVRPTPRDWPAFLGYAQLLASQGVVAATVDHRFHDLTDFDRAAHDVAEAVALVRADPRVDPDRVALWFFSAGGLLCADWLAAPPPWLRCVALTYPVLAPLPNWGLSATRFHPAPAALPTVLTRVALEVPEIAATVDRFIASAASSGAPLEVVEAPEAHHAFESRDPAPVSTPPLRAAVSAVLGHLTA